VLLHALIFYVIFVFYRLNEHDLNAAMSQSCLAPVVVTFDDVDSSSSNLSVSEWMWLLSLEYLFVAWTCGGHLTTLNPTLVSKRPTLVSKETYHRSPTLVSKETYWSFLTTS